MRRLTPNSVAVDAADPLLSNRQEDSNDGPQPGRYPSCCVIYDGDCPFCAAYVRLIRLDRLVGRVLILNARTSTQSVIAELAKHFDLNEGMLLILDGNYFHGAEAMNRLALLTGPIGTLNKIIYWMFRSPRIARIIYPVLRAGRNLTLLMLGRSKIGDHTSGSRG